MKLSNKRKPEKKKKTNILEVKIIAVIKVSLERYKGRMKQVDKIIDNLKISKWKLEEEKNKSQQILKDT